MKAIEIYKYVKNNKIEWHWIDEYKDEKDVVIFPYYFQLEDFEKLLQNSDFDDEGIECNFMQGYVAIKLRQLLENHDIELSEVFTENESDF